MNESNEADRYLLEQVRKGSPDGWRQFVDRYQGRLLAFARARVRQEAMAEDLVQETFLSFLQSMQRFRLESSLETYLFCILKRKVIDVFRGRKRTRSLDEPTRGESASRAEPPGQTPAGSWYARRDEHDERLAQVLATGLSRLLGRLREGGKFRDLEVVEACFYAQRRNKEIAAMTGLDETRVGVIKHRSLEELRRHVAAALGPAGTDLADFAELDSAGGMLTEVWEQQRLTCPKRSTIGRYLLGTLEEPWRRHVEFHVEKLGCRFCLANLDDLRRHEQSPPSPATAEKLFQSTVGFLRS